jgi:hypothetical protein
VTGVKDLRQIVDAPMEAKVPPTPDGFNLLNYGLIRTASKWVWQRTLQALYFVETAPRRQRQKMGARASGDDLL